MHLSIGKLTYFAKPASLVPRPPRRRLPRLIFWALGALFGFRLSLIVALYLYDHQSSPVASLDPDFVANCHVLLSPSPTTYLDRLGRLVAALQGAEDSQPGVWIAEPGPSSSYFLGVFSSSDWWLSERPFLIAITPASDHTSPNITLLTPKFEELRAQLQTIPEEVQKHVQWVSWQESDSPYAVLAQHLGSMGEVIFDPMVRSFVSKGLTAAMDADDMSTHTRSDVNMVDMETGVALIRERKDEREVGLLRCANQVKHFDICHELDSNCSLR